MKKLFVLAAAVLVAFSLNAQIGVKVGGNFTGFSSSTEVDGSKMGLGMNVGAIYEMGLVGDMLSLRFEALYSQKGYDIYNESETAGVKMIQDVKTNIDYLEIPVLAKLQFGDFYVDAGPYFGYALSGKTTGTYEVGGESTEIDSDVFGDDSNMKKTDFGIHAGLGYEFGLPFAKMFVEGRTGLGMMNLYDEVVDDEYSRNFSGMVSVGFLFGK